MNHRRNFIGFTCDLKIRYNYFNFYTSFIINKIIYYKNGLVNFKNKKKKKGIKNYRLVPVYPIFYLSNLCPFKKFLYNLIEFLIIVLILK
jgi:hypothetical protein